MTNAPVPPPPPCGLHFVARCYPLNAAPVDGAFATLAEAVAACEAFMLGRLSVNGVPYRIMEFAGQLPVDMGVLR